MMGRHGLRRPARIRGLGCPQIRLQGDEIMRTAPDLLEAEVLEVALRALEDWTLRDGKLHRSFEFRDFVEAFGFMAEVALVAERSDHHPEWSNVYKRVTVDLTTHEADGITTRDLDLARAMDRLAARRLER
jgi:4a-hydroxytetrahydrobiopterin dehydratase